MRDFETETVYTTAQAARLLGVSPERIRQLRRANRLPGRPTPLGWLFNRSDVLALKAARRPSQRGGR